MGKPANEMGNCPFASPLVAPLECIDLLYESGIYLMRKGDFIEVLEVFRKTKEMVIEEQLDDENNSTCVDLS